MSDIHTFINQIQLEPMNSLTNKQTLQVRKRHMLTRGVCLMLGKNHSIENGTEKFVCFLTL